MSDNVDEILLFCPNCSTVLEMNGLDENCKKCRKSLLLDGNVYNFVEADHNECEKAFYDGEYGKDCNVDSKKTLEELELEWDKSSTLQDALVRKKLGDIKSKTMVMLGNGASLKELALLRDRPKWLVYSDFSPKASMRIKATVDWSGHDDVLRFAAIDAECLPFVDSSIDIVYAYAMVHHLPDLERFFQGVMRVLKPGGIAIFMDDAYSPLWHYSKQTWLRPLMKKSHSRTGISPEDYRFSMTGGFREELLSREIKAFGGKPFFERAGFLNYLVGRGAEKLLPPKLAARVKSGRIQKAAESFDRSMSVFKCYQCNQIRLVWGFSK